MTDPLAFLTRLREAHPDFEHIFQNGCCYELARIMRTIWPQARALYDGDHVFVEIDGSFYDIRGQHENPPDNLAPVDLEKRPWEWKKSAPRIHGNREALERVNAMVAAALREAADIAHDYGEEQYSENVGLHPEYADNAQEDAQEIMQRILDITLDDAKKALDAMVKAERERVFGWLRKNLPDGHAIVAAIREGDSHE